MRCLLVFAGGEHGNSKAVRAANARRRRRGRFKTHKGRDLHLMYSSIGGRRTLTRDAMNIFDYEDEEHATKTLRGLRVLRGAIVLKHIELR